MKCIADKNQDFSCPKNGQLFKIKFKDQIPFFSNFAIDYRT